jgi:hypothetical protein
MLFGCRMKVKSLKGVRNGNWKPKEAEVDLRK